MYSDKGQKGFRQETEHILSQRQTAPIFMYAESKCPNQAKGKRYTKNDYFCMSCPSIFDTVRCDKDFLNKNKITYKINEQSIVGNAAGNQKPHYH